MIVEQPGPKDGYNHRYVQLILFIYLMLIGNLNRFSMFNRIQN